MHYVYFVVIWIEWAEKKIKMIDCLKNIRIDGRGVKLLKGYIT